MTALLEKAIAELKNMPEDLQDQLASIILDDLLDETLWQKSFKDNPEILRQMAIKALDDFHKGDITEGGFGDD